MHIPKPFIPVELETNGLLHTAYLLGRTVTFGADSLPVSVTAEGEELLASPVRLVGTEDGEELVWDSDYPDNESESFVQHRTDAEVLLCGAMRSERFIVDTAITVSYDGNIAFDCKLMPRGDTVAEVFGMQSRKPKRYRMDRLWLEIPLRKEAAAYFNCYPNGPMLLWDRDDTTAERRKESADSYAGLLPERNISMPFKALLWIGSDERGLGFFAENDRNWQPKDSEHAVELIRTEDALVLRVRLLDSHPKTWREAPENGKYAYEPLTFRFGLQPTPVKPFPGQPYLHNGMHLDCFIKIKGNYRDFLYAEDENGRNRFDRLAEKGVTTLILHEKWNKSQNYFELSEYTAEQISLIVKECHRRGIRVLTYFGYEISSLSPAWSDYADLTANRTAADKNSGGWYRVPFQRDYWVCYHSEWADRFVEGITRVMDTYHTDGVYLDGTSLARCCYNVRHGCGWYDADGVLHGTYPIMAVRQMLRKLYEAVEARGGMINVHCFGCNNFTALPFIHLSWYGEDLQFEYLHGKRGRMPLELFRAVYTGRNMGVPVEFIAYENRPIWTFENAVALSAIHGILPRPNDIEGPLDLMSGIWKIIDDFPVDKSVWCPYWKNSAHPSDDRIKVSYYRYLSPSGKPMLLAFCSNTTAEPADGFTVSFEEPVSCLTVLLPGQNPDEKLSLGAYGYCILLAE